MALLDSWASSLGAPARWSGNWRPRTRWPRGRRRRSWPTGKCPRLWCRRLWAWRRWLRWWLWTSWEPSWCLWVKAAFSAFWGLLQLNVFLRRFLSKLNIYSDQFTLHSKSTFNYIHAFPGNQTHDLRIVCTFQTETTLNNFSLTWHLISTCLIIFVYGWFLDYGHFDVIWSYLKKKMHIILDKFLFLCFVLFLLFSCFSTSLYVSKSLFSSCRIPRLQQWK